MTFTLIRPNLALSTVKTVFIQEITLLSSLLFLLCCPMNLVCIFTERHIDNIISLIAIAAKPFDLADNQHTVEACCWWTERIDLETPLRPEQTTKAISMLLLMVLLIKSSLNYIRPRCPSRNKHCTPCITRTFACKSVSLVWCFVWLRFNFEPVAVVVID